VFVWRDFREDGKFMREKWRERKLEGCLVGRGSGKFCGGAYVFSPQAHKKVLSPKWEEN